MSVEQEILVTGIKVVDLLAPYAKGGKIGKVYSVGVKERIVCAQVCLAVPVLVKLSSSWN